MISIYCDESGYTGDNLIDKDQQYFVYSSVKTNEENAKKIINNLSSKFQIKQTELKGKKLLKYRNGRNALKYLFMKYNTIVKFVVHHKKYALSAKLFEYCIEPVISENNSFFYNIGFHRFIANGLFYYFHEIEEEADQIYNKLYNMLKNNDTKVLSEIISITSVKNEFFDLFIKFCMCHKDIIKEEIITASNTSKWILDLSLSSLYSLLCSWGESGTQLQVFCDNSKPIEENKEILNVMINREDIVKFKFGNTENTITFILFEPINFIESSSSNAIQLADLFSSTLNFALKNTPNDLFSKEIISLSFNSILFDQSVFPDRSVINMELMNNLQNYIILKKITEYSEKGLEILSELKKDIYNKVI